MNTLRCGLDLRPWLRFMFSRVFSFQFFFFFCFSRTFWLSQQWTVHQCTVHGSHKVHFSATFSLKLGLTTLFKHLNIILLQYFQFLVFSFNKISSIQTDPKYHYHWVPIFSLHFSQIWGDCILVGPRKKIWAPTNFIFLITTHTWEMYLDLNLKSCII